MKKVNSNTLSMNGAPTVVYFGAEWCSSCPVVEKYLTNSEEKFPQVQFLKVDVKEDALISEAMRVLSLPTVIFFDGNKEKSRFSGSTSAKHLISFVADYYTL